MKKLRGLYRHLTVFILSMLFLFFFEPMAPEFLPGQDVIDDGFLNWVSWASQMLPLLWSPVVLLHLISVTGDLTGFSCRVFTPAFLRPWEERDLRKAGAAGQHTEKQKSQV